jgi:hypothetical protein
VGDPSDAFFAQVVGRTIVAAAFDPNAEGTFEVALDDGRVISLTSPGDAAPSALLSIDDKPPPWSPGCRLCGFGPRRP